jgi:hypothetical protein
VIFAVVLAASAANATQVIYRTPLQLAERASIVALGTVTDVRSSWNEQRTKIFTEITVNVAETYKGDRHPSITIVQPGGVAGIVRVTVSGVLSWEVGEEVLVIVEPLSDGLYRVSGFSQGKYRVERDPETHEAYVLGLGQEPTRLLMPPGEESRAPSKLPKMPIGQFIEQVLHLE